MLDKLITILSERGLQPRPHQLRNILDYTDPKLPHVAACATAAGKTVMTAGKLELYYQCGIIKPHEKVLIIPSDKTILRGNFLEQFDKFFNIVKSSFTYVGVEDKKQLKESIDSNVQVIIGLPQLIKDHTNLFKDVSWLIVDEAHKWYFAPTITNIIREVKPKHQFLLTGTPYKFNLHKNNFIIDYTTVRSLYQDGYICDVNFQVLHSSLPLTRLDYKDLLDNVRQDKRFGKEELEYAFNDVINELVNKLKLPNKNLSTVHNISKNIFNVFGKLEKTIIFTHGIPEANCISEYLKINGVNVITSHSKIDGEIAEDTFNEFRDDKDIKVLISVNRGKEGFDFPELYNIIDMTYSQNFEVVQQMMGRLMRPSLDGHEKVFYKVAPRNTSGYFSDWMDCLIQLFDDYWYSKFNGRNTMDIRVPNNLINRRNVEETISEVKLEDGTEIQVTNENVTTGTKVNVVSEKGEVGPVKDGTHTLLDGIVIETKDGVVISNNRQSAPIRPIRPKNLTTMGFDNSLSFMEKNDYFKLDDPLSTVSTTSLRKIIGKFYDIRTGDRYVYSDGIKKEYTDIILSTDENGKRKYEIISDLQNEKGLGLRMYKFFERFNLMNELYELLPLQRKEKGYWTKEENILKEALRLDNDGNRIYKEASDLRNVHSSAWKNAHKLGILYTKCGFPYIDQKTRLLRSNKLNAKKIYSDNSALEMSKNYTDKTDLCDNNRTLWQYLKDKSLLDKAYPKKSSRN